MGAASFLDHLIVILGVLFRNFAQRQIWGYNLDQPSFNEIGNPED